MSNLDRFWQSQSFDWVVTDNSLYAGSHRSVLTASYVNLIIWEDAGGGFKLVNIPHVLYFSVVFLILWSHQEFHHYYFNIQNIFHAFFEIKNKNRFFCLGLGLGLN